MAIKWTLYEKNKLFELVKEYEGKKVSWLTIADEFEDDNNCNDRTPEQLRSYWKANYAEPKDKDEIVKKHKDKLLKLLIKRKIIPIETLCKDLKASGSYLMLLLHELIKDGYDIVFNKDVVSLIIKEREKTVISNTPQKNHIKIGIVTDTHIGSKYQQITALHRFYEEAQLEGVETFFHIGDLSDGFNVYGRSNNHLQEVFLISFDDTKQYIVDNYPVVKKGKTYMIDGNHDLFWYNLCGVDIVKEVAQKRSDIEYLGRDEALVIYEGYNMLLHHGSGKNTINRAYKLQRLIDTKKAEFSDLDFVFQGHYHNHYFLPYKNVFGFQGGCFQGKTPFGNTQGFPAPIIGGWIIEAIPFENSFKLKIEYKIYPELSNDY